MGKDIHDIPAVERIHRGMAMLDDVFGPGWPLLINLSTFDIHDGNRCVLGQIGAMGAGVDVTSRAALQRIPFPEGYSYEASSFYYAVGCEIADINGAVTEKLFEGITWPWWMESKHYARDKVSVAGGFDGTVDNEAWIEAIRARQEELGGPEVVKAAQKRYAQRLREQKN